MPSVIGNIIVILILAVVVYFAGRRTIRDIRAELNGEGCSSCGGGCSGCAGHCASCGAKCPKAGKK